MGKYRDCLVSEVGENSLTVDPVTRVAYLESEIRDQVYLPWEDLQKLVINMGFQLLAASARVEPAGEEE